MPEPFTAEKGLEPRWALGQSSASLKMDSDGPGNDLDRGARDAERREWTRFWKVVLLATIIPFICLLGGAEWLGWSLGETYTPEAMARTQARSPDLVWMGVRVQGLARIKLAILAHERPDVVIMGQSRLGQAQASMFAPYTFYNMTRVAWPLYTYTDLLRRFPAGYRPRLIIFNADFFMFGSRYDQEYKDLAPVYDATIHENLIETDDVITECIQHPVLLWKRTDYLNHPAFGILTILSGDGTRADGSEQPGANIFSPKMRSLQAVGDQAWRHYLTGGPMMEAPEMADLKAFVDLAKSRGIPVVGVQMPYFGPALRSLEADPDFVILKDFRAHISNGYFDQLGIPFFNFESFPPYTEDYHYFFDGVHPGEVLTAAVIGKICADTRIKAILPRLDPKEIQRKLEEGRGAPDHLLLPP